MLHFLPPVANVAYNVKSKASNLKERKSRSDYECSTEIDRAVPEVRQHRNHRKSDAEKGAYGLQETPDDPSP